MPQIPVAAREDRRMEWVTMSKGAERSRRIRTEGREAVCTVYRDREECGLRLVARSEAGLKQDWLIIFLKGGREFVRGSSFTCFGNKRNERYRTVVLYSGGVQSGCLQ